MNATYDRQTGEVRNDEGHLIGTVKFNGRSGSYGRRWQAITAQGELVAQAATYHDGIAALTA